MLLSPHLPIVPLGSFACAKIVISPVSALNCPQEKLLRSLRADALKCSGTGTAPGSGLVVNLGKLVPPGLQEALFHALAAVAAMPLGTFASGAIRVNAR